MITVEDAKSLVEKHSHALPVTGIKLDHCIDHVLAEDILAPIDLPTFPQSAMDGYAIRFSDFAAGNAFTVTGEMQAGAVGKLYNYTTHSAIRIFTGAQVPVGYDTVVMQEHCSREKEQLLIDVPNIVEGMNVRLRGSEIHAGEMALQKGTLLSAGAIGYLTGMGITQLKVFAKPRVQIIVTGKELVTAGHELQYGQVYESNASMLEKALQHLHFNNISTVAVDDDPELIQKQIERSLQETDLVLITGGVSVGDYDFVSAALQKAGVETIFRKVKQKPGKPLWFGRSTQAIVFGLPGNPSSVLTCFYQYVCIALQKLIGRKYPFLVSMQAAMSLEFRKPAGLTHFLKGSFSNNKVYLLPAQESFRLSSFATANCLVQVPGPITELKADDPVTIQLLPL